MCYTVGGDSDDCMVELSLLVQVLHSGGDNGHKKSLACSWNIPQIVKMLTVNGAQPARSAPVEILKSFFSGPGADAEMQRRPHQQVGHGHGGEGGRAGL